MEANTSMLVAIIVIIIVFGLVAAAAIIALKLLAGVIKAIALFTKPVFCMILGLAMNTNKVMIVESKFLNWLIWTLIFYAVIFVLCGRDDKYARHTDTRGSDFCTALRSCQFNLQG